MPYPTLFLSKTTLTFKQAFFWLAQKVRTAGGFLFEGKKIHPCSLKSWVQQAFQLQQEEEKNASLLTSLVVFWYESCKRWDTS